MPFQYLSPFSPPLTEKCCKNPKILKMYILGPFHTLQNTVKIDDDGEEGEKAMQGENKVK